MPAIPEFKNPPEKSIRIHDDRSWLAFNIQAPIFHLPEIGDDSWFWTIPKMENGKTDLTDRGSPSYVRGLNSDFSVDYLLF